MNISFEPGVFNDLVYGRSFCWVLGKH